MSTFQKVAFAAKARVLAPRSFSAWKKLRRSDQFTREQLAQLRERRSLEIARFAFENSAFYRSFYKDHGITGRDLEDPESFYSLPFLTKDLIRENFDSIKTAEANARTASESISSGSTGHPLTVLSDRRAPVRAYEWRTMGWWGVEPWRNGVTIDRDHRSGLRSLQHRLFWWTTRRILLNTLELKDETVSQFLDEWAVSRPQYVVGFIGGVHSVANFAQAQQITLAHPVAVAVTAGPLLEGHRQDMQHVFGAPVYNHYRSTESNWLAAECTEQDGLHSFDDIKNLEVISDRGIPTVGEEKGETVFTDFENRVFPLVRYRLGDRTSRIAEPCHCGRPFRRVAAIEGRMVDSLFSPSGREFTGDIFTFFEGTSDHIRQYQIYQDANFSVTVACRLTDHRDARNIAEERVARLRAHLRAEAPVVLEVVDEIEAVRGKFRPIVSDAPRPVISP